MEYDIEVINPSSNVALSTLWTRKEAILSSLPEDVRKKIGIIGTTYTYPGVLHILKTLGEHPRIDVLIIFGADLSESGDAIVRIFKGEEDLPEGTEKIIQTVKVIDLRGKDMNSLIKAIKSNFRPGKPVRERININIEEKTGVNSFYPPLSGHYIYDNSLLSAWVRALNVIMRYGTVKGSQYGELQKEFMNLLVVLGIYGEELKKEGLLRYVREKDVDLHVKEVLHSHKPEGVSYTYGERIGDQLDYIISTLRSSPESRRAVAVLWKKEDQRNEQPPCLVFIEGLVSEGYYHHTAIFRSHDMMGAWPINVYAQYKLALLISKELETELGTLSILSISAHIYQHDWKRAQELIERESSLLKRFIEDPKGNYVIYREGEEVTIEHRTMDHKTLIEKASFHSYKDAYQWIKGREGYSLFDHALYIGRELFRAFKEKNYRQDQV